jgi:hypothetical protein
MQLVPSASSRLLLLLQMVKLQTLKMLTTAATSRRDVDTCILFT